MSPDVGRCFVDSNVLIYASGRDHPLREASADLLRHTRGGEVELHVSTEAIAELVFHRRRAGSRSVAVAHGRYVREFSIVHPFDDLVLERALQLIASGSIRGRDAVHAATALQAGFASIVTADRDFYDVPGLQVLSPEQVLGSAD